MIGRRLISSHRRSLWVTAGIAALVVGIWLLADSPDARVAGRVPTLGVGVPILVDRPEPTFVRPLLSGAGSFDLAAARGRVIVVNFFASWCSPCRAEAPLLESVWRTYRDEGVQVVGVAYRDGRTAAIRFASSVGISYPSVLDGDGTVGGDFGIFGLPTTYIIGPDARVRFVVNGRIHGPSFRDALDRVIDGAAAEP